MINFELEKEVIEQREKNRFLEESLEEMKGKLDEVVETSEKMKEKLDIDGGKGKEIVE